MLVGKEARRRLAIDPLHTVYNAKRFIGREYVYRSYMYIYVRQMCAVCALQYYTTPLSPVL